MENCKQKKLDPLLFWCAWTARKFPKVRRR